jgi:dTDP-4-dehydrorhamnose reductase
MLGHRLCLAGATRNDVEVWGTARRSAEGGSALPPAVLDPGRLVSPVEAEREVSLVRAIDDVAPQTVINAVGLIKQRPDGRDPARATAINAELPHVLASETTRRGIRLVHLSTDCVFDGRRGAYTEEDQPAADDLYGRTKALGEPAGPSVSVLRTSMIGRELSGSAGLLEWFLAAPSPVPGYRNARFSGLTTAVLADVLLDLATSDDPLEGLFHVAGPPIDKASLLALLAHRLRPGVTIETVDEPVIDRTLDGRRFAGVTGFVAPTWEQMVDGLAAETYPYDEWRAA